MNPKRKSNLKKLDSFTTHDLSTLEKASVYGGNIPVIYLNDKTDPALMPRNEGDPDSYGDGLG